MKRPDIYGDEAKCRTALARCIKNGEDLLAQADGVKKRIDAVPGDDVDADMTRFSIDREWGDRFRKWFTSTQNGMRPYLQDQFKDVLPTLFRGLPLNTGKPRHAIDLENGAP